MASWPGQNGQCSVPGSGSPSGARNWCGRASRPVATITVRSLSASYRTSVCADMKLRLRAPDAAFRGRNLVRMPHLVVIGGGPAGNTCASVASTLGADVTVIERDVIGGAAHLWDCIPSKALIATGGELAELQRAHTMGIAAEGHLDIDALRERVQSIESRVQQSIESLLTSQGVRMIRGTGRLTGPRCVVATTAAGDEEIEADFVLVSTGSRPRVPDFAPVDGDRVLTTRDAYPPPEIPEHAIVIGSGVTGVEFTHLFQSLGSQVTLLVSRQQVLPIKDPEVAAVLEESFLDVGVKLLKGARAESITRDGDVVRVHCDDGREITGSHVLLAVGSIPNTEGIGLEDVGVVVDERGCIPVNHNCLSNVPGIYAAGDVSGKLPLSSVAAMQGRKIAEHLMGLHNRPAPAPRLREGRVGGVHRPRDRRRRPGRGRGVLGWAQDPGHQGAVLVEPEGAHQGRRRAAS